MKTQRSTTKLFMAAAVAAAAMGASTAFAQQAPPGSAHSGGMIDESQPGEAPSGSEMAPAPSEMSPHADEVPAMPSLAPPMPSDTMPPAPVASGPYGGSGVGLTLQGEAGIQAFSGPLSDSLRAGPAWGADALIRPHVPVGLELRYQGASNQLFGSGNFFNGPREARVVQNGGQALLNVPLAKDTSRVQPFLGSGIGFAHYSLSEPIAGYRSDNLGQVPLAAGINFHVHPADVTSGLTLGLRGDYDILFDDQFAPTNQTTDYGIFTKQGGDQYRGSVTLGGTF